MCVCAYLCVTHMHEHIYIYATLSPSSVFRLSTGVLLVLGLVLDDQLLPFVAERVETGREPEEARVLRGLHTLILLLIASCSKNSN